jgi:protein SCO1/2
MDSRKYFIVTVAISAMVTGVWMSYHILMPPPVTQTATLLPAATELAEFSLLDQDGNAFTPASFEGHWNLVFFGFTHCPDVCPLTLQVLANARQQMTNKGVDELPRIVLVSVDPERDTPEIIGQYVSHFGADAVGVTGDLTEIHKLTDGIGIFFEKSAVAGEIDSDNYSVDHSAVVLIVNPDGKFHGLFGAPHIADNFAHDMPIIMSAR